MMAIMLDTHFKALHVMENLVGHENVIQLALIMMSKLSLLF